MQQYIQGRQVAAVEVIFQCAVTQLEDAGQGMSGVPLCPHIMPDLFAGLRTIDRKIRMVLGHKSELLPREYDFIIDGTDNFPAKFLINDACVLEKKPFSHAGIIRFKGQLMTYVPGEGPCYRCVFKNPPPKDAVPTCKQAGVIGAMGGVIGSLQAMEAIKYLIGVGDLLTGYLLTFDALTMEFHKVKLPKDTHDCAVCGDHPTILEPIDYEQEVCEETAGRFATRDEQ